VTPDEMMAWFKAIDPGKFKMGSKEYWESAMNGGGEDVPPTEGVKGTSQFLTTATSCRSRSHTRCDARAQHFPS
jgi:hypothetical protein